MTILRKSIRVSIASQYHVLNLELLRASYPRPIAIPMIKSPFDDQPRLLCPTTSWKITEPYPSRPRCSGKALAFLLDVLGLVELAGVAGLDDCGTDSGTLRWARAGGHPCGVLLAATLCW